MQSSGNVSRSHGKGEKYVDSTGPFVYMRFVNHSRYLPQDKSTKIQRRRQPRGKNLSSVKMFSRVRASKLKDYQIFEVMKLRNIDVREELCFEYGSENGFP